MRLTELTNKGMNGTPIYVGSYGNIVNVGDNQATSMVHGFLGAEDISEYCKCPRLENWGTEEHCVYMMLVGMFGDWGTSIRGGWIEDCEECKKWLEEAKAWVMGEDKDE